jgi:4-amino-4-deoxy-L-arabinose transferase-like glycosyltransferase
VSRRTIFALLTAIIVLASFLRLFHFESIPPGLYSDEAIEGNDALEAARTTPFLSGLKVFYPENNGREGLYVNAVAVLFKISGAAPEPWIVRLPAAISGILTVFGIYFLAAELFGQEIGLLAALFLATSLWHINFSRIGFRAIMAPFFLTWALYFLLKGFRQLRSAESFLPVAPSFLFGGVLWALGLYTYIAYRISLALILLLFAFYWFDARNRGRQKQYFAAAATFCASSLIVVSPLMHYFFVNRGAFLGRASQISIFNSPSPLYDLARNTWKTLAMFNGRGDANWRHNVGGAPELFWPVGLLFLLGIVVGLASLIGKFSAHPNNDAPKRTAAIEEISQPKFPFILLFAWLLVAAIPVVISDDILPHALRSLLMIPAVFIFAAVGARALYRSLRTIVEAKWLNVAAFCFLALLTIAAYHAYFITWARNPVVPEAFDSDYVSIGRELNALPASIPKYVVVEATGVLVQGIPMPAQTVMFITDTYSPDQQAAKNIHYVLPSEINIIPAGAVVVYVRDAASPFAN